MLGTLRQLNDLKAHLLKARITCCEQFARILRANAYLRVSVKEPLSAPFTPSASARVYTRRRASTRQIKLMLKIVSIHTDHVKTRVDARQVICIHGMRCQFKLYIGYWTSNNNKWPKCSCRYRTPAPDNTCANDVINNDVTDNDVIDSWMNEYAYITCK